MDEGSLIEMSATTTSVPSSPGRGVPAEPRSVEETGIRKSMLEALALKLLYLHGPFSLFELSRQMRLSLEVAEELFERLRLEQLCAVTGLMGNIPNIAITDRGRTRGIELMHMNQYSGPAPVSMESYRERVREQSVRHVVVHAEHVERAFSHMVMDNRMLSQVGTALNSGASVFLYGPSGTGKTTIAEVLSRVVAEDKIWLPYAVEVDSQIITIFDPLVHHRVERAPLGDERWVLCDRPAVMAGGEMTLEMLDLQFGPVSKFYSAPLQMKANNGVLIIDDFGRQRVQPEALLNRWVVPLDRRIDFLTLAGGKTIEVPFEVLVVFATNRDPKELLEDAFLRRIQTKIKIDTVADETFCEIFRRAARERGLECDQATSMEVAKRIREQIKEPLRPCYPRDLINQVCWAARYEGRDPKLDRTAIMQAVDTYFLDAT